MTQYLECVPSSRVWNLYHSNHQSTSTPSSMTVNVSSVLWDGWQSLVIIRNVKVIPMMTFLQLRFALRSTKNLRRVSTPRLSATSTSIKLKYEISNSNHLKNPTAHLTNHCCDQPPRKRWHCHKTSQQRRRSYCMGQETIHRRSL